MEWSVSDVLSPSSYWLLQLTSPKNRTLHYYLLYKPASTEKDGQTTDLLINRWTYTHIKTDKWTSDIDTDRQINKQPCRDRYRQIDRWTDGILTFSTTKCLIYICYLYFQVRMISQHGTGQCSHKLMFIIGI